MHNRGVHRGLTSLLPSWRLAGQIALLTGAYYIAARLALLLAIPPGYATAIWPASGIALAALLVRGGRIWPGVWLGSFIANLHVEGSLLASLAIASASTLQAVAAAALIQRHVGIPYRFTQVVQVVKFVALSALAATIAPTLGALPLALVHPMPGRDLFWNWWTWWQGDATGMLLIAPLVVSWAARDTVQWTRRRAVEGLVFWVLLLFAAHVVFDGGPKETQLYSTTFILVPFIVWAAFRFGQRGVITATAAVCGIALWYTLRRETGPFSGPPTHESLLLLLAFISTLVATGLVLCAVLDQLDSAMTQLRSRQAQLEAHVRSRTHDLEEANRLLQEDIGARMRIEKMLTESERRFRLMVDSVVDYAIFRLDTEGRVASWNAGAQRIKGYSAEEIIGENFSRFYPEEDVARGKPAWELETAGRFHPARR